MPIICRKFCAKRKSFTCHAAISSWWAINMDVAPVPGHVSLLVRRCCLVQDVHALRITELNYFLSGLPCWLLLYTPSPHHALSCPVIWVLRTAPIECLCTRVDRTTFEINYHHYTVDPLSRLPRRRLMTGI